MIELTLAALIGALLARTSLPLWIVGGALTCLTALGALPDWGAFFRALFIAAGGYDLGLVLGLAGIFLGQRMRLRHDGRT